MRAFRAFVFLSCVSMSFGMVVTPANAADCRRSSDVPREVAKRELDCRGVSGAEAPAGHARRGSPGDRGFIDLGNGTSVRVTGRVRADTLYRR
jgi:hypothetical protein